MACFPGLAHPVVHRDSARGQSWSTSHNLYNVRKALSLSLIPARHVLAVPDLGLARLPRAQTEAIATMEQAWWCNRRNQVAASTRYAAPNKKSERPSEEG